MHFLGSGMISSLKINTLPSSSLALLISCPRISEFYTSLIQEQEIILGQNEINIDGNYYLIFPVNVRECVAGEIFISSISM